MKYEIAYISKSGNTERLAYGIADLLPHNETFVTNLATENITRKADVYLIGFGVNKGTIPLSVMEALEDMSGKTLMFFVTSAMEPAVEYRAMVERKLCPFIPDECDYRGLFMCQGGFSDEMLKKIEIKLSEEPDNPSALKLLQAAELSAGHPDKTGCENAYRFILKNMVN